MKGKVFLSFAALLAIGILLSGCSETTLSSSVSQPGGITLRGTVYDLKHTTESLFIYGDFIPNATVFLVGDQGNWTTTSNQRGEYTFNGIPDGYYTLKVTAEGYAFLPEIYGFIPWMDIEIKPFVLRSAENSVVTKDIYLFSFPTIVGYAPEPNSIISNDQVFTITFSEAMDTSSVRILLDPLMIRTTAADSGDTAQLDLTWSSNSKEVTVTPIGNLISNEVYRLKIVPADYDVWLAGGPFDSEGNPGFWVAPYAWGDMEHALDYYADYRIATGGVPSAPSNLQVLVNDKPTSEVDFEDVIEAWRTVRLSWSPSTSGSITGYKIFAAKSGSVSNYAPLERDISTSTSTINNYFTSRIDKVKKALYGGDGGELVNPITTQNYPFVNNTVYFKVVAYNGDGESDGVTVSVKDVVGPKVDLRAHSGRTGGGFTGGAQNNNYYLPSLIAGTDTKVAYIAFGEPVDPDTITAANFSHNAGTVQSAELMTSHISNLAPFFVWLDNVLSIVRITSDADFSQFDTITAGTGVKDLAGNPISAGYETGTIQ